MSFFRTDRPAFAPQVLALAALFTAASPTTIWSQEVPTCSTYAYAELDFESFRRVFTSDDPPYPGFRQRNGIQRLVVQEVPMGVVTDPQTCLTLRQAARQVLQQYLRGPVDLDGVRYGFYRYGPYFAVLAVLSPTAHRSPLLIFRADTLEFLGDIVV